MNPSWDTLERSRQARLERAAPWARGREVASSDAADAGRVSPLGGSLTGVGDGPVVG